MYTDKQLKFLSYLIMKYIALCFLLNCLSFSIQEEGDLLLQKASPGYFWRDYNGEVPTDAIVGGKRINDHNIYIGQAYVQNVGLIVVQIYDGVREVYAPYDSRAIKVDKYIKVLCGPTDNLYWLPTNNTNLDQDLVDKHAILGGHEDGRGDLYIGRASDEGEIRIGKVDAFNPGNGGCYYVKNSETEVLVNSFEIFIAKTVEAD